MFPTPFIEEPVFSPLRILASWGGGSGTVGYGVAPGGPKLLSALSPSVYKITSEVQRWALSPAVQRELAPTRKGQFSRTFLAQVLNSGKYS